MAFSAIFFLSCGIFCRITNKANFGEGSDMKCVICGVEIESVVEALESDWIPCFFEGDEIHGPACADCRDVLLTPSDDGEFDVKDEYFGKILYSDDTCDLEEDEYEWEEFPLGFILN